MLKIRLSRFGKKKEPRYRIIVSEGSKDPWGDYLDKLGTYNPQTKEITLDAEKIKEYIAKGAQPSDTVRNLLIANGVIEGKKINVSHISNKRTTKLDEAKVKEDEAKAEKAEADKAAAEAEASTEEVQNEEPPAEETKEEVKTDEAPKEEVKEEPSVEEVKTEEVKEEPSVEEVKTEEVKEEPSVEESKEK